MTKYHRFLIPLFAVSLIASTAHAAGVERGVGSTAGTEVPTTTVVNASVQTFSAVEAPSHKTLPFTAKAKATPKFWDKLAYCETGGDWTNGGNWAGGLGIARSTWSRFGGKEFAPTPDKATRDEQIIVANRISTQGYTGTIVRDPEWAKVHGVPQTETYVQEPVGFTGWGALPCAGGRPKTFHYDPKDVPVVQYEWNQRGIIVKDLQNLIGVNADGHYGLKTREAHVRYLKVHKLSTLGVAKLPDYLTGSYPQDKAKRCPQWEGRLRFYGLQPVDRFSYIMWRESRCNEKAVSKLNSNGTKDYGLLQINSSWVTVTNKVCGGTKGNMKVLLDYKCNLRVAKYLLDNGGMAHWSATSGSDKN